MLDSLLQQVQRLFGWSNAEARENMQCIFGSSVPCLDDLMQVVHSLASSGVGGMDEPSYSKDRLRTTDYVSQATSIAAKSLSPGCDSYAVRSHKYAAQQQLCKYQQSQGPRQQQNKSQQSGRSLHSKGIRPRDSSKGSQKQKCRDMVSAHTCGLAAAAVALMLRCLGH